MGGDILRQVEIPVGSLLRHYKLTAFFALFSLNRFGFSLEFSLPIQAVLSFLLKHPFKAYVRVLFFFKTPLQYHRLSFRLLRLPNVPLIVLSFLLKHPFKAYVRVLFFENTPSMPSIIFSPASLSKCSFNCSFNCFGITNSHFLSDCSGDLHF